MIYDDIKIIGNGFLRCVCVSEHAVGVLARGDVEYVWDHNSNPWPGTDRVTTTPIHATDSLKPPVLLEYVASLCSGMRLLFLWY